MRREGEEIRLETDAARAGSTPRVVRYVLIFSLALAVIAMTLVAMTSALAQ